MALPITPFTLLLALTTPAGAGLTYPELPVAVPDRSFKPLTQCLDPILQRLLEKAVIADAKRAKLVGDGRMAVGLVDLREPASPRFAHVNGDKMIYAASLPKLVPLLAAHVMLDAGTLKDSPALQHDMARMIRVSDNDAATAVIDRMGMEKMNAVLLDPRFKLYDKEKGGGLWCGKRYARSGKRYPEPMAGLSHAATAVQVCRFFYLLATGRLVSHKSTLSMLGHLSKPGIRHHLVAGILARAPKATMYRKSGSWKHWFSDSVMVWGPGWRRYILVGLIEDGTGAQILRELVPLAEDCLLRREPKYPGEE